MSGSSYKSTVALGSHRKPLSTGVSASRESEYDAPPAAVIVHDPAAEQAFAAMGRIEDRAQLERRFLFRQQPHRRRYALQHRALVDVLRRHVPEVLYLADLLRADEGYEAERRNPNLVFTRDSLITVPWIPGGYLYPRMKKPSRRGESDVLERAVRRFGLTEITRVPEPLVLEGGDVVPFASEGRRRLLIGFGPRTSVGALEFLQDALPSLQCDEIVAVELAPWRMNLDGGLLPVAEDVVISDTKSILGGFLLDRRGKTALDVLGMLRELGMRIVETTPEESVFLQSCNGACLGERKIIYYDLCPRVHDQLVGNEIEVLRVPGSELVKGRGGPRCMTRPIYAPAP